MCMVWLLFLVPVLSYRGMQLVMFSSYLCTFRLKSHMSFVSVIAIYAPTNPVSSTADIAAPYEEFYNLLQSTLSMVPQNDRLVILGDFNARVVASSHILGTRSLALIL